MLHPAILNVIQKLEGAIAKMYLFCSITSSTLSDEGEQLPDRSLSEVLFDDLVSFSLHVSLADGEISDAEIECIKRLFSLKWSKEKFLQYSKDNAPSVTAASKTPEVLKYFAKADQIEIQTDGSIDTYSCEFLFDCFKAIGSLFIWCDGSADAIKQDAVAAYLANLKTCINKEFPSLHLEA